MWTSEYSPFLTENRNWNTKDTLYSSKFYINQTQRNLLWNFNFYVTVPLSQKWYTKKNSYGYDKHVISDNYTIQFKWHFLNIKQRNSICIHTLYLIYIKCIHRNIMKVKEKWYVVYNSKSVTDSIHILSVYLCFVKRKKEMSKLYKWTLQDLSS